MHEWSYNISSLAFLIFIYALVTLLTITNPLGEIIEEQRIISPKTEINLSSQPSGIYFLRLTGKNINVSRSVVKN